MFATGGNDNLCFLFETDTVTKNEEESDQEQAANRIWAAFREPIPPPTHDIRQSLYAAAQTQRSSRTLEPPPTSSVTESNQRQASVSSSGGGNRVTSMGSIDGRLSTTISAAEAFAPFLHGDTDTRFWDLNTLLAGRTAARYPPSLPSNVHAASESFRNPVSNTSGQPRSIDESQAKHRWEHMAAVKAIAFCPWRDGLVATGGGSHDKCIHFYHTTSGVALATIAVHAQVTSLIWSTTRREIAATFGYAQPDHPYRIAVFSWPECRQVAAIP